MDRGASASDDEAARRRSGVLICRALRVPRYSSEAPQASIMIRATHTSTPVAAHSARGCTQNHLGVVQACERPLHITSRLYRGSSKLRSGANVNAKQDDHCKPLHETTCRARQGAAPRRYCYRRAECDWEYAVTCRVVLWLLECGADVDTEDDEGRTAYQIAL